MVNVKTHAVSEKHCSHFNDDNSKTLRQPGIEPGSIAWKATMLTFTPPTLVGIQNT